MPNFEIVRPCERGEHKLKPRYDSAREGEVYQRKYVCDVCSICGHQVPRPFTAEAMLEQGVVTALEVRQAIAVAHERSLTLSVPYPLEAALAAVVMVQAKAAADSE